MNKTYANAHLAAAIEQADPTWASLALRFGAEAAQPAANGDTPLHMAVRIENEGSKRQIIESLILKGASVAAQNKEGQTALELAQSLDQWDLSIWMATVKLDD